MNRCLNLAALISLTLFVVAGPFNLAFANEGVYQNRAQDGLDQSKLFQYFVEGESFYKDNNLPQALYKFTLVNQLDPNSKLAERAREYMAIIEAKLVANGNASVRPLTEDEKTELAVSEVEHAQETMSKLEKQLELEESLYQEAEALAMQMDQEADSAYQVAWKLYKAGEYQMAINRCQSILELEKNNPDALKLVQLIEFSQRRETRKNWFNKIRYQEKEVEAQQMAETEEKLLDVLKASLVPKNVILSPHVESIADLGQVRKNMAKEKSQFEEAQSLSLLYEQERATSLSRGVIEASADEAPSTISNDFAELIKQPVTLNFVDAEMGYVLNFLLELTQVNIIADSAAIADKKVSVHVKNMPLVSALEYILRSEELIYAVEKDAIWVTTPDNIALETRIFHLSHGLGAFARFSNMGNLTEYAAGDTLKTGSQGPGAFSTVKDILEEVAEWPEGSKLVLDERTGSLIVTNTPQNLDKIEELIVTLDIKPMQILIEARFVEVDVTDLSDLGVEWQLNSNWSLNDKGSDNDASMKHGILSGAGFDAADFTNAAAGLNFTYTGILTKPQFQMVLHALSKRTHSNTLSAPKVTTLNNQSATIKIVDEFIYPTAYENQITYVDLDGDGAYFGPGEADSVNVPTAFATREIGILLNVTPSVGSDRKTISLTLVPEVSDFVSFTEYTGSVKVPKFSSRNVTTNIIVDNGQTVVMGGLMKETTSKTTTKVPFLGDIPILGRLFRKQEDSSEKRNLLIFVTAQILGSGSIAQAK